MSESSKNIDLDNLWQEVLKVLESSLEKPTFETCLKNTRLMSADKNTFVIGVSPFAKNWLKKKKNYKSLINDALYIVSGKRYNTHIIAVEDDNAVNEEPELIVVEEKKDNYSFQQCNNTLNSRYTFGTFVIGENNRLAHAASIAVSESPGTMYNPLFIYGGVGLGKTHLLQAIGHKVMQKNNKSKVFYVSTEKFAYEFIQSIQDTQQSIPFKDKYRNVDVLLIDDIQFLMNKERTQEEFFNTFNALHHANKQIVISSDRPPKEIHTLHDRLRSRFEWGLIADIQPPDLETRMAILGKKAEHEKKSIPNEVIQYIAEKVASNIRELEGALIKVIAFASFNGVDITEKMAKEVLKDILSEGKDKTLTPEIIQKKVSEYFGIKVNDIISEKRDQRFSYPRQIAMYFTREMTNLSTPDTAKAFGKKDHSTVLHACKKISSLLADNPSTKNDIDNIKNLLKDY